MLIGGSCQRRRNGADSFRAEEREHCEQGGLLYLGALIFVTQGNGVGGVIEKEKLHLFNIPQYTLSLAEMQMGVEKESFFTPSLLEASKIRWADWDDGCNHGNSVAKCMRLVVEPMLVEYFDDSIIEQLFDKYHKILSDHMSKEETKFVNVTVSMIQRG